MFENYVFNLNTLLCIVCHHLWKYLCITRRFCVCSNLFKIGPPTRTLYYFKLRPSIYYQRWFKFDELIVEQKLQFLIVTINSVIVTMVSPKSQPIRCKYDTKSFAVPFLLCFQLTVVFDNEWFPIKTQANSRIVNT